MARFQAEAHIVPAATTGVAHMTMMPAKFKTAIRAAVIALALGGSALATLPAEAQQGPAFSFSLDLPGLQGGAIVGNDNGIGNRDAPRGYPRYDDRPRGRCLTSRDIRRGVEARGYDSVEVRRNLSRNRVEVVGRNGNWLYAMRVDKCSGEVDRLKRIRRVQGGGFGLQFNFGN
jgi:hypothetical protein